MPRRIWILLSALALAVPLILIQGPSSASAAPEVKKKKKGPSIVLPAKKAKTNGKETKPAAPRTDRPEKVDLPGVTSNAKTNLSEELRGPTRIDFDDRLIQGQTNKSGAVYLFDRKETGISSMVRRRKSFKQLTLETIYDR